MWWIRYQKHIQYMNLYINKAENVLFKYPVSTNDNNLSVKHDQKHISCTMYLVAAVNIRSILIQSVT